MKDAGLSQTQLDVMHRVLAEEEAKRRHVVIALSGAHAYGFPSPDSDLDLKSIHAEPTRNLLGIAPATPTFDRMEVIDGVEIDYTSNELRPVLLGVLQGNGNYIERVLGPLLPYVTPERDELAPLVKRCLSRRIFRHYIGFATSQLNGYRGEGGGTAKKLLYVLRTALTGAHALRTGELVTDLRELHDDYGLPEARELIEAKRSGERMVLPDALKEAWDGRIRGVFDTLVAAHEGSVLPLEPDAAAVADLEAWLLEVRRRRL